LFGIEKVLTENDLGLTGSHQAGFLIPKALVKSKIFSELSHTEVNPRARLKFEELKTGDVWYFNYIFYNSRLFGGSRSEYRLTGLATFLRAHSLQPGDSIVFKRVDEYDYEIEIKKTTRKSGLLSHESWLSIYGESS
jgi:Restriction endonuclease EcoRII, N-terminal